MSRKHTVATADGGPGLDVPFTPAEEIERDREDAEFLAAAPARRTEKVREAREAEYPSEGDVIDAMFKKEAGDPTDWDALAARRRDVKRRHPLP